MKREARGSFNEARWCRFETLRVDEGLECFELTPFLLARNVSARARVRVQQRASGARQADEVVMEGQQQ